ncbi:TPA: hypothetical protein DCZ36_00615 [Candidatus Gracilibacteria bacterium]|nr:hypothetical protein [Candidatus Gracilibacteria bacterium]
MSPKYQAEKGQLDEKKNALIALTNIPCTSEKVADRDRFIGYIEAHKKSSQIFSIINFLSPQELYACFDEDDAGTSFANACNSEFIDTLCNKVQQEVTGAKKFNEDVIKVNEGVKGLSEEQKQVLLELRTKLGDEKKYYFLGQNRDTILDENIDPSSQKFKEAAKSILAELKTQAQKSGDFKEYAKFVTDFHAIGAVSDQEFLYFKKELDDVLKESPKSGDAPSNTSETLEKGLRKQEYERFGDVYIRFGSLGEKTNEIVRIDERSGMVSKRIVSDRSGYAREVVFPKTLELERDMKVGQINEQLSDIGNKLAKITEYKKDREKLEQKAEAERTEEEKKRMKQLETIEKKEQEILNHKARLEREKNTLPMPDTSIQKTQKEREEQARNVVQFVDDIGLNTIGIENVDVFFEALNSRMNNGNTFDINKGLTYSEKTRIKQFFIQFLGEGSENLFEKDETKFILGKEDELRERLRESKGIAPPIKTMNLEEMKRLMEK